MEVWLWLDASQHLPPLCLSDGHNLISLCRVNRIARLAKRFYLLLRCSDLYYCLIAFVLHQKASMACDTLIMPIGLPEAVTYLDML